MFGTLTSKLQEVLGALLRERRLSEQQIEKASRDVQTALMEADVHYEVARTLMERVKGKALGVQLLKAVEPGQQFVKIVFDELVELMGKEEAEFSPKQHPTIIFLVGLQGCGKTTMAAKLARWFQNPTKNRETKKCLLVACDLQRPAAVEQLRILGEGAGVPVVTTGSADPVERAAEGVAEGRRLGVDVILIDTAGRLQEDVALMDELQRMKKRVSPQEVFFVASAHQGQDALHTARTFHEQIGVTGNLVTMLDGTARAGVVVSLREITKKPVLFEGCGERLDELRLFHPTSMAHRILGMGDTIHLVKTAQEHFDAKQTASLEERVRKAEITYDDFLQQAQVIEKLGSMRGVLKLLPAGLLQGMNPDQLLQGEQAFKKYRAIIQSMTREERMGVHTLGPSRMQRMARGAGLKMKDVEALVSSFKQMKQMLKNMPNMKFLEKFMGGGARWL